ncbi:MAG: glycosyltransferase [Solimonas sp.]
MKTPDSASLLVAGVHQSSDAYPNTLYRVRYLRDRLGAHEVNRPMWSAPAAGWKSARSPLRALRRAIPSHLQVAWAVMRGPRFGCLYIPYPAPPVAWLLSLLPRRSRRVVLDGFISLYDTVINDRKLWSPAALPSRLLYALERRAFARADLVLVDTPQNAAFYAGLFRLPPERFFALPLATNEDDYAPAPYRPLAGRCRVLFIGTLVPLHGIGTLAEAARRLASRRDIEFRILGDGAGAPVLQSGIAGLSNVTWKRRWHTAGELACEIREADICLGIFGDTDKTQRVCPYKLYSYASVGRATITGDTQWLRSVAAPDGSLPFRGVSVHDAAALADAIRRLADAPEERVRLADAARRFYAGHLSNAASMQALERALFAEPGSP